MSDERGGIDPAKGRVLRNGNGHATAFDGDSLDSDGRDGRSLALLRAEAQRLIADIGPSLRRITLRAGSHVIDLEWEQPAASSTVVRTGDPAPDTRVEPAGPPVVRVSSPLVGSFYRAPAPGEAPFVEVGDHVAAGQQIAIIEAMKLMNPIVAEHAGRLITIGAEDGAMVEFDQMLFELAPIEASEADGV